VYSGITLVEDDLKSQTDIAYRVFLFDTVSGSNFNQKAYLKILGTNTQFYYVLSGDNNTDSWNVQKRIEFDRMYGILPDLQGLWNTTQMSILSDIMDKTKTPYFDNMLKFAKDLHSAYELDAALQTRKTEFYDWCKMNVGDPVEDTAYRDKLFTMVTTNMPDGNPYNKEQFLTWLDTHHGDASPVMKSESLMVQPSATSTETETVSVPTNPSLDKSELSQRMAIENTVAASTVTGANYTFSSTMAGNSIDTVNLAQHSSLAIPVASRHLNFQQELITRSMLAMPETVGEYIKTSFMMPDPAEYEEFTIKDGRKTNFSPEFEALIESYRKDAQNKPAR